MVLKVYLNRLFYDLSESYFNPIQEHLNNILGYTGTIADLINDFTRKVKRDNNLLTYAINLYNYNCITALFERYELIDYMMEVIS